MKHLYFKNILLCLLVFSMFGCSKYDDSGICDYVKGMNTRLAALEEKCKDMNTNITSLQAIVAAFENGDYITNVAPVKRNNIQIGYTITFLKSAPITIYNGNDGVDGNDGNDGYTPVISVKQDTDGLYYWTVDGEWLLTDGGKKVRASGIDGQDGNDGSNGTNGTNGTNGITPLLKIEGEYWYVSYDAGTSWQMLGKATGDKGKDGASFFSSVDVGTTEVTFVLADGTRFSIPLQSYTTDTEHEYVDLGLPSGTLWATCNVGAEIPWEFGDYFAWGETEPKYNYTWDNYKYCTGSEHKLTKYGAYSKYGIVDNKSVLEPMDDAATANWGSEWQMPSREQFKELIDENNNSVVLKMQYGVYGLKITSKRNGKSIFLSAAGVNNVNYEMGCYWTCDLVVDQYTNCLNASSLYIDYQAGRRIRQLNGRDRYTGASVRPVRKQ